MHKSSYCGVNCEKCKVYIATLANSNELKSEIAEEWGKLYNRQFTKDEMICYGCKSDHLFELCYQCDIRTCNENRGTSNCKDCDIFPCERMDRFFDFHTKYDTGATFD